MRPLALILVAVTCIGCSAAQPILRPSGRVPGGVTAPSRSSERRPPNPAVLRSRLFAELPRGSSGPYLGQRDAQRLVVWAEPQNEGYAWHSVRLDVEGHSLPLIATADQPDLVVVRPIRGNAGIGARYCVLSSVAGSNELSLLFLEEDGRLSGGPERLGGVGEQILWMDAFSAYDGTAVVWASSADGSATIQGSLVTADGASAPRPYPIVGQVLAWQFVSLAEGAALAVVRMVNGQRTLQLVQLDRRGRPSGEPLVVEGTAGAGLDLDMVVQNDRLLLAWTESTELGDRIMGVRVDPRSPSVDPVRPLLPESPDQALIRLVPPAPGHAQAYAVWEQIATERREIRRFTVAAIAPDGQLGLQRAHLDYAGGDGALPEFVAHEGGLVAMTRAYPCPMAAECDAEEPVSMFVEWDHKLELVASQSLAIDARQRQVADFAWGLSCAKGVSCRALGTVVGDSAAVYDIELSALKLGTPPATRKIPIPERPSVEGIEPLAAVDRIADLAAVEIGSARLVAWVTDFDAAAPYKIPSSPAPDGRKAPVRALLDVLRVSEDGSAGEPLRISWRARSTGGIALAASSESALVVWSALDGHHPEVFVTLLDNQGTKRAQRMLTHQRSEVYSVAAARVEGGWIVAWVDNRNGDPEVYAVRLNERLDQLGPAKRITRSKGVASGLALATLGSKVLAVWSDDRIDPAAGIGGVYGIYLRVLDAAAEGAEWRLSDDMTHAHSPVVASVDDGAVVAWLERGPNATNASSSVIRAGQLDTSGQWTNEFARLESDAPIVDLSLHCNRQGICHGAFAKAGAEGVALTLFQLDGEQRFGSIRAVKTLSRSLSLMPGLSLTQDRLYLADEMGDHARINEFTLNW